MFEKLECFKKDSPLKKNKEKRAIIPPSVRETGREGRGQRWNWREGGREGGKEANLLGVDEDVTVTKHGSRPELRPVAPNLGRGGGREEGGRGDKT